jgi:hypothetical protein
MPWAPGQKRATPLEASIRRLCFEQSGFLTGKDTKKKQKQVQLLALDYEVERAEAVFDDWMRGVMIRKLRQ